MKIKTYPYQIDYVTIIASILLLSFLVICTICVPDVVVSKLVSVRNVLIYHFGAYFILFTAGMLFYNIWLAFSKYGDIRLGRVKPQYSYFGWAAMIFCAAMGCTILFWSAVEWAYYIAWIHPFGLDAEGTAEIAVSYSFFHWGIPAWSIYATGVVPIAYRYYVRKQPGLSIQGGCEGVLGKAVFGSLGTVINIIFIFGVLGGLTISYGTGIPMLADILHNLLGSPETFWMDVVIIVMITVVFIWSACSGIARGIQFLSKLTIYISLFLIAYFLLMGHSSFEINNTVESFGQMLQNFWQMLFYLDPTGSSGGFPQEWTVFYWAWWLGLAPVMWIFIAKCSAGRSIRSVILTVILAGSAGSWLYFGTVSNYGLGEVLLHGFSWDTLGSNGTLLDTFYNTFDTSGLVSDLILSLPGGKFVLATWFITAFILFVTTMDSSAYTMAAACTKGLAIWDDPARKLRLLFSVLLSICPLCLLWAGSSLSGFKSVLIITSVPVSLLILCCIITCHKWVRQDFGSWTREEIIKYFAQREETVLPPIDAVENKRTKSLRKSEIEK
jgi:BCCT family betaine/carnitine transporter